MCGTTDYVYIVRSDLNAYMRTTKINAGSDIVVHSLHPACTGGDHYLALDGYNMPFYYIIKGDQYKRVTNMNTDSDSIVYSLHPNCRGGDRYLAYYNEDLKEIFFYIVFLSRGKYRYLQIMLIANLFRNSTETDHPWAASAVEPARGLLAAAHG